MIATLAEQAGCPVLAVTGDRDLFHPVDDRRGIAVTTAARGVGRADIVREAWISDKYDIPGRGYADFATLRGDPSDGRPGEGNRREDRGILATPVRRPEAIRAAAADPASGLSASSALQTQAGSDHLDVADRVVHVVRDARCRSGTRASADRTG